nr:kinesin-like protein subito [Leptinotarsa decemlineata]
MEGNSGDLTTTVSSFIYARDPSILAWSKTTLEKVKVNLEDVIVDSGDQTTASEEENESKCIQVFLRMKGGVPYENLYQIDNDNLICKVPEGSYSMRNLKYGNSMTRTYTFSKIFGPDVMQIEIFNSIVKPRILGFINGRNSTLFTYGASGSGKTFTIVGTPNEPGLIPRALEYIFRTLSKIEDKPTLKPMPNGTTSKLDKSMVHLENMNKFAVLNASISDKTAHIKTYKQMQERLSTEPAAKIDDLSNVVINIWVSFAEIYNESIYDLLISVPKGKQRPRLALGQSKSRTYIKNLSSINVCNGMEAYQVLQFGLHNLKYAATAINSHSSRSHCIFTITLVQMSKMCNEVCISSFNFCDLAGSERSKKTMNIGDRLKESNNINTSLLVLGRCIENVRSLQQIKDKRLVPFRESKLTQLFQRALMGFENIEMIVNINPCRDMFDETYQALNFAAIAKEIVIEEQPTKPIRRKNRFSDMAEHAKPNLEPVEEVNDARDQELEQLRKMVVDLYNEIEHNKEEHYKEVEEEREYTINLYKDFIKKKEIQHKEEIEEAVERTVERLEEQHRRKIEQLKFEFLNKSSNGNDSVISIDDSSTEEASPQKKSRDISDQTEKIQELKHHIALMEVELSEQTKILKKYQQNQKQYDRQIGELQQELDKLKIELTDSQVLLRQAKESYMSLLDENDYLKEQRKKLLAENFLLEEKYEMTLSTQNICLHCDSHDSDEENTTTRSSTLLPVIDSTQSASKMRLKEEDKRAF